MAKKAKAETVEVAPQEVVVKTAPTKQTKPSWEIKDRIYFLKGNKTPLTYTIPGKHTKKHALLYFDKKWKAKRDKICYKSRLSLGRRAKRRVYYGSYTF